MSQNSSIDEMRKLADYGASLKPLKKIFGSYVLEKILVHFVAERGTGKTFFMLQLCIAVSNGFKNFCGEQIELTGNTLFINCELGRDLIARRLAKLFEQIPGKEEFQNKPFIYTTRRSFADERNTIVKYIAELKPVLVILDNWKTAYQDIDNNTSRDTTKAIIELLNLKDEYGFAMVVIDHTKKGTKLQLTDSDLQSGSGTKSDLADQDFFLRKSKEDKQFRLLKRIKSRVCEEQEHPKLLRIHPETLWFECEEEEVEETEHIGPDSISGDDDAWEIARLMREKGKSFQEIQKATGIAKSTLHRKL